MKFPLLHLSRRARWSPLLAATVLALLAPAGHALNLQQFRAGCGCPEHQTVYDADGLLLIPPKTAPSTPPPVPPPTLAVVAPQLPQPDLAFELVDGYARAGFDRLGSFAFKTEGQPPAAVDRQIPASIKRLDGKKVLVRGYMLPITLNQGLVTEFLLVSSPQLCCFGVMPAANQWVIVKLPSGVPPTMDVPLEFLGRLHVGALYEQDYLAGIYQLDGEKRHQSGS